MKAANLTIDLFGFGVLGEGNCNAKAISQKKKCSGDALHHKYIDKTMETIESLADNALLI
jgi:hypothetical protein